ncbi:MAG: serine protease [Bacteroidales bacterium]|nr:serine protease [Bacteroidales bacterium]
MGLIIALVLVGLVLILAEILLIPGVGVAGILGLLSLGGSCYYSFYEFGNLTGGIVTGVNALLLVITLIYVLRAKTWKRMSLETNIDSKAVDDDSSYIAVGDKGQAVTRLAPMGMVRFGERTVEVKALEGILESGTDVEVVMIEDRRIYVNKF